MIQEPLQILLSDKIGLPAPPIVGVLGLRPERSTNGYNQLPVFLTKVGMTSKFIYYLSNSIRGPDVVQIGSPKARSSI